MALPSGTVTFLFTDVEGSTALAERLRSAWPSVLGDHRRLLAEAIRAAGGEEVDARGEETLAAFATAWTAIDAALAAQRAHARHPWPEGGEVRVRIGVHTGEPTVADARYLGLDVHRGARICGLAHGGQVLLSQTTRDLLPNEQARDLGEVTLKGLSRPERVFQLVASSLDADFPALRERHEPSSVEGREHELASAARRLRRIRIRQRDVPGLAELGWEIRRLLPKTPSPLREELAALAGDLFAAGRSAADVDIFVSEVDRRVLLKRQVEHAELAVLSRQAQREVDAITRRLGELDEIATRRHDLDALAIAVREELPLPVNAAGLRERLREATARLDAAMAVVRRDVGTSAARYHRTLARGVYRQGNKYVVQVFDTVGVERPQRFETLRDARTFRRAQVLQEKRQQVATGAQISKNEFGGGGG